MSCLSRRSQGCSRDVVERCWRGIGEWMSVMNGLIEEWKVGEWKNGMDGNRDI